MNYKELKNQIKDQQKQLAKEIRDYKNKRKTYSDGYVPHLDRLQFNYRHKHIAYCMFFNKTPYEMIEQSCHEAPLKSIIEAYKKDWEEALFTLETEDFI